MTTVKFDENVPLLLTVTTSVTGFEQPTEICSPAKETVG